MHESFENLANEYKTLLTEIKLLENSRIELKEKSEYYAASFLSHTPKGSSRHNTFDKYLITLEKIEDKIIETLLKVSQKRLRIEAQINNINNEKVRCIIRMRVVNGCSWQDVASAMHISASTAKRKYIQALSREA